MESKESWKLILRSDDPRLEIEEMDRLALELASRPVTAVTTVSEDSTESSLLQYPSLGINGDEDAGTPEIIVYETIGFRIGHDNDTHETLININ